MKKISFNNFNSFYLQHKNESDALVFEVLESGKYIRDRQNNILESNLCKLCNRDFSLTTASCTDAIFFALKAAGIKEGDEIILPSFSYIASLSPILMCGAFPVFADIDPNTLVLDVELIENIITKKTKAIIFVQLFGNTSNLDKLQKICHDSKIVLIEDAAQALGSCCGNIKGASQGDFSCISFDPTKIVSAYGTGGAIMTNNEKYNDKLQMLIHHGRSNKDEFEILGYNSKIPEVNAALINLQLSFLDKTIEETNNIAEQYVSNLKNIAEIKFVKTNADNISTFHKFVIFAERRDELKIFLKQNGIETKIHYSPLLHEQKLLKDYKYFNHDMSVSKQVKREVISLPIYTGLKKEEIDYICACIQNFYRL